MNDTPARPPVVDRLKMLDSLAQTIKAEGDASTERSSSVQRNLAFLLIEHRADESGLVFLRPRWATVLWLVKVVSLGLGYGQILAFLTRYVVVA